MKRMTFYLGMALAVLSLASSATGGRVSLLRCQADARMK